MGSIPPPRYGSIQPRTDCAGNRAPAFGIGAQQLRQRFGSGCLHQHPLIGKRDPQRGAGGDADQRFAQPRQGGGGYPRWRKKANQVVAS